MGEAISEGPALPLDGEEVKNHINELVQRYNGAELVEKLAEYFSLSLIEIILVRDPSPKRLEHLSKETVETIGWLSTALPAPQKAN